MRLSDCNPQTSPGPGDPVTWGPPAGHPHDPRTEDCIDCQGAGWVDEGAWCDACHGEGTVDL